MFLDKHARFLVGALGLIALAPQVSAAPWSGWHHRYSHGPGDQGDGTSAPSVTVTPSSQPTGIFSSQPVQLTGAYSVSPTPGTISTPAATPSASVVPTRPGSTKGEFMIPYYLYPGAGKWEPLENLSVCSSLSSPIEC